MPFQCCMNKNERDGMGIEEPTSKKIPRILNLNEGYCNNLEILTFDGKSKVNQLINTNKNLEPKIGNFPVSFLETKISNLSNINNVPTLTQASSNVIISGHSSPIKILTRIENPNEIKKASNAQYSPLLDESLKKNFYENFRTINKERTASERNHKTSNIEHDVNKNKDNFCNLQDHINYNFYEINCEKDKFVLNQGINNDNQKDIKLYSRVEDCKDSCLIPNKDISQYSEYKTPVEFEKINFCSGLAEKRTDEKISTEDFTLKDTKNKPNIEEVRDDIDKLVELSKKLRYDNNPINKKKKKTEKKIHIEITFSPKNNNNVVIDTQRTKNSNKNISPINKIESETYSPISVDNKKETLSRNSELQTKFSNEQNKAPCQEKYIKMMNKERIPDLIYKKSRHEVEIPKNSNETYESRLNSDKEVLIFGKDLKTKKSSNKVDQKDIEQINFLVSEDKVDNNSGSSEDPNLSNTTNLSNESIKNGYSISSEKFIPFIGEEIKVTDNLNKSQNQKPSIPTSSKFSLTYENNKEPNNFGFSKETLEKLNGSMPVVNSDPQMAQLFASAQLHIEKINDTRSNNTSRNEIKNEDDPMKAITKFLEDPSENKVEIWSTVKAIIDVYEPQIKYAKKELERWTKEENFEDEEVKENIEYYNNLVEDLQQRIELADQAKQKILNGSNLDEIKRLLDIEQNYLDEIKEKMSLESDELRYLEEKYLNGNIEYKEKVRSSRIKIKQYEDEMKNKLMQIHELKDLLKISDNI